MMQGCDPKIQQTRQAGEWARRSARRRVGAIVQPATSAVKSPQLSGTHKETPDDKPPPASPITGASTDVCGSGNASVYQDKLMLWNR